MLTEPFSTHIKHFLCTYLVNFTEIFNMISVIFDIAICVTRLDMLTSPMATKANALLKLIWAK